MFQIGDKILYPMYGAGSITSIEVREVLGKMQEYYLLNIPHVNMEIMIPVGKAENLGIRQVVDEEVIEDVLRVFHQGDTDPLIFENNNRFYKDINRKKIKSGDVYQEREIIRDLIRKSKKHKLGTDDTNMLDNARKILASEIMQVKSIEHKNAMELLNQVIFAAEIPENPEQQLTCNS